MNICLALFSIGSFAVYLLRVVPSLFNVMYFDTLYELHRETQGYSDPMATAMRVNITFQIVIGAILFFNIKKRLMPLFCVLFIIASVIIHTVLFPMRYAQFEEMRRGYYRSASTLKILDGFHGLVLDDKGKVLRDELRRKERISDIFVLIDDRVSLNNVQIKVIMSEVIPGNYDKRFIPFVRDVVKKELDESLAYSPSATDITTTLSEGLVLLHNFNNQESLDELKSVEAYAIHIHSNQALVQEVSRWVARTEKRLAGL